MASLPLLRINLQITLNKSYELSVLSNFSLQGEVNKIFIPPKESCTIGSDEPQSSPWSMLWPTAHPNKDGTTLRCGWPFVGSVFPESLELCFSCWLVTLSSGTLSRQNQSISVTWDFKKTRTMACWELHLLYGIDSAFLKIFLELKCSSALQVPGITFLGRMPWHLSPCPRLDHVSLFYVRIAPYISFVTAYSESDQASQVEDRTPEC